MLPSDCRRSKPAAVRRSVISNRLAPAIHGLPFAANGSPFAANGLPLATNGLPFAANGLSLATNGSPWELLETLPATGPALWKLLTERLPACNLWVDAPQGGTAMSPRKLFLIIMLSALIACPAACQEPEETSNASAETTTTGAVLPGFPSLGWSDGMCMYIGCLNLSLNYLGEKTTYQYLMGVSGAAFATRFHPDWRSSSADAALTDDHTAAAMAAVGYSYEWAQTSDAAVVTRAIDRGLPVIACDPTGRKDWGVIVGYGHMGESFLCRTYFDAPSGPTSLWNVPSSMLMIGRNGKSPTMAENLRAAIGLGVEFARGERKARDYSVGFGAYEAWIDALGSKKLDGLVGRDLEDRAFTNAWLYNSLIDARYAGVTFLTWAATMLKDERKARCEEALRHYQEEIGILKDAKDFVQYPQNIKSGPKWTAVMRSYQIDALRRALAADRAAVASLEKIFAGESPAEPE